MSGIFFRQLLAKVQNIKFSLDLSEVVVIIPNVTELCLDTNAKVLFTQFLCSVILQIDCFIFQTCLSKF